MKKQKKLLIQLLVFLTIILSSCNVFAADFSSNLGELQFSESYKQYVKLSDEEKENAIMPRMYEIPKSRMTITNPLRLARMARSSLATSYSLWNDIPENMVTKNQQETNSCWTFSILASLESNLALKNKLYQRPAVVYDFSERHMEYATSKTFLDGVNENGFNREVGTRGNVSFSIPYLTNGTGAIAEADMPFENNEDKVYISEIQGKDVITQVNDVITFPSYSSTDDKTAIKQQMKEHIKNYGAIDALIHAPDSDDLISCYNIETGAFYTSNSSLYGINHAVAIIGWDDEYAVENFTEGNRPTNKGAWIIKNSWGTEERFTLAELREDLLSSYPDLDETTITDEMLKTVLEAQGYTIEGDEAYIKLGDENGFMYISYEDANVYLMLTGIIDAQSEVTYENIYQYDQFGGFMSAVLPDSKIYLATEFDRQSTTAEYLTQVSIMAPETYTCKVYVNPNGSSKAMSDLQQVELKSGETETFDAGYHTIEFLNPVQITGDKFVVVLEIQGTQSNQLYTMMEYNSKDYAAINQDYANNYYTSWYDDVEVESGKCFWTYEDVLNTGEWYDASTMATLTDGGVPNFDTTIKAFTVSKVFESISITTPPTKTSYFVGEDFDATGMVVKANYSDGTSEEITNYTISNGTDLTLGQTEVTITYEGKITTQSIQVVEKSVESIAITTPPTKTEYLAGEAFDATGMVVEATYTDGTTQVITDYTIQDGQNLTTGQTSVTIEYEGKTATQAITVQANAVVELKITQEPNKTEYVVGQDFDATGMVVKAIYESGLETEVTDYTIQDGENLQEGQTEVTIEYEGKTVTQAITVEAKTITSISVKTMPSKTEYIQNKEELDLTGGVIEITYNDGTTEELSMTSEKITVTGFSNKEVGTKTITLTYEGKTTQFNVEIKALAKPVNSNFDNTQANVKKIKVYTYTDASKQEKVTVEVELTNIVKATENEKMEYYYYLSTNPNEANITNWTKIDTMQDVDDKLLFEISSSEISNYTSLANSNGIYLYVKEVATRNNMTAEAIESLAVTVGNVPVEQYVNDVKVGETDSGTILDSMQGVQPDNTLSPDGTTKPDDTTAPGVLPNAGKSLFIVFLAVIIFIIGRIAYLRYRDIQIK